MFHLIELVRLRGEVPFAYHYASSDVRKLQKKHQEIMNKFPDVGISTHSLDTDDETWESVVKMDPYFDDVTCLEDISKFGDYLSELNISSFDICSYILGYFNVGISFKKMEKLLYFVYCDYLEKTHKPLFYQHFDAWDFGPVESHSRYARMEGKLPSLNQVIDKIAFSADSSVILSSLNSVLQRYGSESENELIARTHREGSPWNRNYEKGVKPNATIPIADILKYHYVETTDK